MKAIRLLSARTVILTTEADEKLDEVCLSLHGEVTKKDKTALLDDIIASNLEALLLTLSKEAV